MEAWPPPGSLHDDGLISGAPMHEGMGSGGGAHGDGPLAVALPLNLSGMVLQVILLLGGYLRAVHPPSGLLVRPPLGRLLQCS